MTHALRKGECLHCAVRDLVADDIALNENSTPATVGANLGQAFGDCIALDPGSDERYVMAIEAIAAFVLAVSHIVKIDREQIPTLLDDAESVTKRLAIERKSS